MANERVRPQGAFLNQKIQFGGHAFVHVGMRGLDEEAMDADVEDTRDIVASIATPADPDIFRSLKPGQSAAGIRRFLIQEGPLRRKQFVGASGWGYRSHFACLRGVNFDVHYFHESRAISDATTGAAHDLAPRLKRRVLTL